MNRISAPWLSLVFLFTASLGLAQVPENIRLVTNAPKGSVRMACGSQFAGDITFGTFIGQSNDISPDTIFLCYDDSLQILNDNSNLSGDPKPATEPGVGYAFYKCKPTVSGPSLNAILNDACRIQMPPPTNGIWVATQPGVPDGDIWFHNSGYVQSFFNSGKPQLVWFAPITLDDFASKAFEIDGSGIPGACVNVNTINSFAVVYLNEIQISNVNSNAGSPIAGTFYVYGGLPEYETAQRYVSIQIELVSNPAIKGTILGGPYKHGDQVNFTVPQAGDYRITVVDGKNGSSSRIVKLPANDVSVEIACADVQPDGTMCIQFQVSNFTDVASAQFTINWDPLLFQFQNTVIPMPAVLPDFGMANINVDANSGTAVFVWYELNANGVTLPDGSMIMEMCFKAIGPPNATGQFYLDDNVASIEFLSGTGTYLDYNLPPCSARISIPTNLIIYNTSCSSNLSPASGSINFSVFGGNGPYSWSFTAVNPPSGSGTGLLQGVTQSLSNLAPGDYAFTVTDASGATVTKVITVALAAPLQAQQIIVNPTCYGEFDGSLTIDTITGGLLPYYIQWSTGQKESWFLGDPDPKIDDLVNGTYKITITDALGCQQIYTNDLIASPISLIAGAVTNASCSGKADGQIMIQATGGKKINGNQYEYIWQGDAPVTAITSSKSLLKGDSTYYVKIRDANGCELDTFFTVTNINVLSLDPSYTAPVCYGETNGSITATGSNAGGPAALPYTFTWSPNAPAAVNAPGSSTISPLAAGTYSVTMTDQNGCTLDSIFTLAQPDSMKSFVLMSARDTCFESTGKLLIGIFGGTVDPDASQTGWYWDIQWSNDSTGQSMSNLAAGFYTATVTDFNNCTNELVFEVKATGSIDSVSFVSTDLACPFDKNGSVTATVHLKTGASVKSFQWSPNAPTPTNTATTSSLSGLTAGWYYITVTTNDDCQSIDSIEIQAPDSIEAIPTIVAPTCELSVNGSISLVLSGGSLPYKFVWSNGKTTQNITGLVAGVYTVSISDALNCPPQIFKFTVPQPPFINFLVSGITSPSCEDRCDGRATVSLPNNPVNGPFTITWEPGGSFPGSSESGVFSSQEDALCSGLVKFTITDANGCTDKGEFILEPAVLINIDQEDLTPVTCYGGADGTASITSMGGEGPYTYKWDLVPDTDPDLVGLKAGDYIVTITDDTGCTGTDTITILQPDSLDAFQDPAASHGISCGGYGDGLIVVAQNGGNPGTFTYQWSGNISQTNTASDLEPGDYVITVADSKGCSDTVMVTLTEPVPVTADIPTPPEPQCFGLETFIAVDNAFGGTGGNYTFSVNNGSQQPISATIAVGAGTHLIEVFDGNGCAFDTTITIDQPPAILVYAGQDTSVSLGDSVQLFPVITSVFPITTYTWTPSGGLSCDDCLNPFAKPFKDQQYVILITDANGCTAADSLLIEVDKTRKVFIPSGFSPDDDGFNDIFSVFSGAGVRRINSMSIFDRWGAEIFHKENLPANGFGTEGWDGRHNGQQVNMGVYVFLIEVEFEDDAKLLYRGDVTVTR